MLLLGFLLFSMTACNGSKTGKHGTLQALDTLYAPRYARGFTLLRYGDRGSAVLEIKNPWQQAEGVTLRVFLSRDGESAPEGFTGEVVPVPIRRAVCMSSTYVAFLDAVGCDTVIRGVSGGKFIYNKKIRERLARNEIADVGYDSGLNHELLFGLRPDVVFIYGISGENSAVTDKMRELGIRVVYVGEYVENSPLGRAEWVVPMAQFVDRRERAETLFDSIGRDYNRIRELASAEIPRPRVMLNAPWRDSWFVPGDRSYIVQLIRDAGGEYACAGVDSDQSRPISIENAYLAVASSDFWLNPGSARSLAELRTINSRFAEIPAVLRRRVYSNNARRTPDGGSDFWESGVVKPHVILKDMMTILHPGLFPEHRFYYFEPLK